MDNKAKDLKLEKDRARLSQTRKKNAKRELENARKKESELLKITKVLSAQVFLIWKYSHLFSFYCLACLKNEVNNLEYTFFQKEINSRCIEVNGCTRGITYF